MEDGTNHSHERTYDGEADAGEHGLYGTGNVETHHEFELGDGRHQVALMHAARFVIDVEHAAADHDGDVHGQRDRPGQQVFHVFDKGVKLDDFKCGLLD